MTERRKIQVGDVLDLETLEALRVAALEEAAWESSVEGRISRIWVDRIATVAGLLGERSAGIAIGYACGSCGADRWIVGVPRRGFETIEDFERRLLAACGRDHRARDAGSCREAQLEIEIPPSAISKVEIGSSGGRADGKARR